MYAFLSGAIMMGCAACGLFFLKSWRATRDRLFLLFAFAFWTLSAERWMLTIDVPNNAEQYYVYVFRLIAFAIIMIAIIDKNRSAKG